MVVLPELPRSVRQEMIELADLLRSLRLGVDVLVVSTRRFRESAAVPGTLCHSVRQEGKVFYGSV